VVRKNFDFCLLYRGEEHLLVHGVGEYLVQGVTLLNRLISEGLNSGTRTSLLSGIFNQQDRKKINSTLPLINGFASIGVYSPHLTIPLTLVFNTVFFDEGAKVSFFHVSGV
jgi:hypothetical protein